MDLRTATYMLLVELERQNERAHTDGSVDRLHAQLRAMTPAQLADHMAAKCREWAAQHRECVVWYGDALRWFAANPDQKQFRAGGVTHTRQTVAADYRTSRRLHSKVCAQLGHWLSQQAQHQPARVVIPAAANDAASAVGKVA
ncbi:MAG: hypothetical protein ACLGJC_05135 [Alphaproteobacteria bacterium]